MNYKDDNLVQLRGLLGDDVEEFENVMDQIKPLLLRKYCRETRYLRYSLRKTCFQKVLSFSKRHLRPWYGGHLGENYPFLVPPFITVLVNFILCLFLSFFNGYYLFTFPVIQNSGRCSILRFSWFLLPL